MGERDSGRTAAEFHGGHTLQLLSMTGAANAISWIELSPSFRYHGFLGVVCIRYVEMVPVIIYNFFIINFIN
jgi:hypothetical protein